MSSVDFAVARVGGHFADTVLVGMQDLNPSGGVVQCVPNTTWDKTNPQINQILATRPVCSLTLVAGDLYLMRTDTTLRRSSTRPTRPLLT